MTAPSATEPIVRPTATGRPAAFFDMDKTVLRIDTGTSWMKFLYRRGELSRTGLARALYWSALYKVALLDLEALAVRLVADLRGELEAEMIAKATEWHRAHVFDQVAPRARAAIEHHRQRGDLIVMLTGSTQYAAEVVSASLGIEHTLCSRLEVDGGVFTGKLAQMCFGVHKVTLAERFAGQHGIDLAESWFYSDSYNDLPMLERVGSAVAVNPDPRLRRHARRNGWKIEEWAT
jgi:HAD superfamily hydrolase (TIGR01490 family)